jgi:PD-(D/E)XK nuclease superfamily protein
MKAFMLKIISPRPEDLENLAQDVIGCCLAVHKELRPGLLESVYPRAVAMELEDAASLSEIGGEHPIHVAQVISYLRLTRSRLGLLINFNVPLLKQGIRRVVL